MISLYNILKEVISPSNEYYKEVEKIKAAGGTPLGKPGQFGATFLVGDKAVKVTTDSEELIDAQTLINAQAIEDLDIEYFVHIYEVEVINPKLGIITMEKLEPFTGSKKDIPIEDIYDEADLLKIYPDLEGSGGSIRMDNIMQDKNGNIKVIDV